MDESAAPLVHTCQSCGTLIDIEDQEPLTLVHCPSCGTPQRVRTRFDHFEIQEVLGAGGMGAVYRAWDTTLNRPVALKLLRKEFSADPDFVKQFQREAAITASINHPNVVRVYSSATDHGMLYIAMELVDKGSLDELMTLQGTVAEVQVLEVGVQVARGLQAAHQRGLVHRDVKPGNILFANAHSAKIVDFGLASLQEHVEKGDGDIWGTPYYVAPEKLDSPPREDFRSDIYSLGASLFHALAGRPPFEAETASLVALKHLKSQVVSLQAFAPDMNSATTFVINRALHKDPDQRYGNYEEFIEHLEYAHAQVVKQGGGPGQKRARVVLETEDEARAMSWITFVMVALVVFGGVGAWVYRDRIFPTSRDGQNVTVVNRTQPVRRAKPEQEERFKATRQLLLDGQAKRAAAGFRSFADEMDVPQPLLNWLTMNEGLALILDGQEKTARKAFDRLSKREPYGHGEEDEREVKFFAETAKAMMSNGAVAANVTVDFNPSTGEAMGYLLFGLKNWSLGEIEDSARLFQRFQSANPEAPLEWIADYKRLLAPISDELELYRGLGDTLDLRDASQADAAIEKLKGAKEKLKLSTVLRTKVEAAIQRLEKADAAAEEDAKKALARNEAAEEEQLAEVKRKCNEQIAQKHFTEARDIAEEFRPKTAKVRRLTERLSMRVDALVEFRKQLIRDLGTTGYTGPAKRTTGAAFPPGRFTGTEAQLQLQSQFGMLPVGWNDVANETIVTMGRSFIRPGLSADETAERQWNLGNFALVMGYSDLGRELLTAAAAVKPQYLDVVSSLTPPVAEKKPEEKK